MAISDYFIRYLDQRDSLTPREIARLAALRTEIVVYDPGDVIVPAHQPLQQSCMMTRGMSARVHRLTARPEERAVSALHVPGDFVDLHGFILSALDHTVVAVGPAEVEFVSHDQLIEITQDFPHLTRLLWMATVIDAAVHRQWLVAAASLRSTPHLAHLLCEIYTRLHSVGAAQDGRFCVPLLQRELAEILGYSSIHVNRAVRELKDRGLLRWTGTEVTILDWPELAKLGQFDPAYLDLRRRSR
jgi:CRP-like cAMP-binding protein